MKEKLEQTKLASNIQNNSLLAKEGAATPPAVVAAATGVAKLQKYNQIKQKF